MSKLKAIIRSHAQSQQMQLNVRPSPRVLIDLGAELSHAVQGGRGQRPLPQQVACPGAQAGGGQDIGASSISCVKAQTNKQVILEVPANLRGVEDSFDADFFKMIIVTNP